MHFLVPLYVLVAAVAASPTIQAPETTPAPVVERRDFFSDVHDLTSGVAAWPSAVDSLKSYLLSSLSSEYANLTASAGSVTSSLGLQLSTADAAASSSISSQLVQVAANVSSASAAMETARSAVSATSTSTTTTSTSTSTSTAGAGCAQTAAVGIAALAGGMAILAHL